MKTLRITCVIVALSVATAVSAQSWYGEEAALQAERLLSEMTVDEKLDFISGDWMYSCPVSRLGIDSIKMSDGPQGLGTHGPSTAYPSTVLLTATWNRALAYRYGESLASDCHARGVNMLLGPAVNIYRAPMCGRNFEYMGEDPYLAGQTAVEYIKGVQDNGVIATVKHFALNNSDYDRTRISSDVGLRALHEIYLPAFKAAVEDAGVAAVMTSYNLYNGIYTSEHPYLTGEVLRDRWGFKGLLVSDWDAVRHTIPAVKNGLDLEMPSGKYFNPDDLKYYLQTGDIGMDMIDNKIRHILTVQSAFGLIENKGADTSIPLDNPQSVATALDVAREGIVLLKNDKGILPLDNGKYRHICVIGSNALGYVKGGGSGNVNPFHYVSILDGLTQVGKEKGVEVEYAEFEEVLPRIVFTDESLSQEGLKSQYYKNTRLEGKAFASRIADRLEYSWPGNGEFDGLPLNDFSARYEGVLCADVDGVYEFELGGDDGYRLYIDGNCVIDNWTDGAYRSHKYETSLKAGEKHSLKIEYYQGAGSGELRFRWSNAGQDLQFTDLSQSVSGCDMIVACIGFNQKTECEGSDRTFALPDKDLYMLQAAIESGKPVVAVLNSGGSVDMRQWLAGVKGLLWTGYAGQEGGTAVAEILFGEVNPSGHLPMTFEKRLEDNPTYETYQDPDGDKHVHYTEGIYVGYRGYDKLNRPVQFPFGYGLSYTEFTLSDMEVSAPKTDGTVDVTVTVKNTGKRDGKGVVQVYVRKRKEGVADRPVRELRQYAKVDLKVGESARLNMTLPKESFMYFNEAADDFVVDAGEYDVTAGFHSRDVKISRTVSYSD